MNNEIGGEIRFFRFLDMGSRGDMGFVYFNDSENRLRDAIEMIFQ